MNYTYMICPKCRNKLIEENKLESNAKQICPICGNQLVIALWGEQKIDDTIYKIILNDKPILWDTSIDGLKEGLTRYDFDVDVDELVQKLEFGNGDEILFEGDAIHTYFFMEALDCMIAFYHVIPEFPFQRSIEPDLALCPECGSKTVEKLEEIKDDSDCLRQGWFCECCKEWLTSCNIPKEELGDDIYKLIFSVSELNIQENNIEKEQLINKIKNSQSKKIQEDEIIISDNTSGIFSYLVLLKDIHINYKIEPPFPYAI